ncbi:MAG TPA: SLC13 family permease, partial [Pyrinomonadaceae bacterium]|nr:SLC13 family permease [Pyrinomonadaceae bacterium]
MFAFQYIAGVDNSLTITLAILVVAFVLFLTEKIPADITALLVMVALGVSGVLTPLEAFSGFSRSAVITIIAIFVLSEALQRTGVTDQFGRYLLKAGGASEARLLAVIMIAGAVLSLFMNNIAAAAVLLPAVSGLGKRSGISSSKLLMPLSFATVLGGMATLFTTSNILLNSLLKDNDIPGYRITDFLPVGIPIVAAGIAYMVFVGRFLLPGESPLERTQAPDISSEADLVQSYGLGAKLFRAKVPQNSSLIGKTLAECKLREDFDVSVVAIERGRERILAPTSVTWLERGDVLVLEGDEADFRKRDVEPYMEFLPESDWKESDLESQAIEVVEAMLPPRSRLIGKTLRDVQFRERFGMVVLAVWRGETEYFTDLADIQLQFGDALLLQGPRER